MISVYQLKSKFSDVLRPICNFLVKIGVTANMVTVSAFLMSVVAGILVYIYEPKFPCAFWLLPVVLFVRMALNNIDGVIAREHNQKTNIGAIYNELGDILSDLAIYVPFLYVCNVDFWLIFLFAIFTIISETVGIMGVQINASRRYDGPMGKSDRAFWLSLFAIVRYVHPLLLKSQNIFVGVVALLLVFTAFNRVAAALKEAKNK